jgi:hypothetical protein
MCVNWTAVGAVATAITGFVILLSVIALARQIRELRRATHAQAYATAVRWLQSEKTRTARRTLFSLKEKILAQWTDEERSACERVCQTYDLVAIMIRHGMLPKEILVENWGQSLVNSWRAARLFVVQLRNEYGSPHRWDDFEWLAGQAELEGRRKGL